MVKPQGSTWGTDLPLSGPASLPTHMECTCCATSAAAQGRETSATSGGSLSNLQEAELAYTLYSGEDLAVAMHGSAISVMSSCRTHVSRAATLL